MNLVDSSGWLEYFAAGKNSQIFTPLITDLPELIVPTICIYEVSKRILVQRDENAAIQAMAVMYQAQVVELYSELAYSAAQLSIEFKLPMADAIILATARAYQATLWTQDADFKNIPGVRYVSS